MVLVSWCHCPTPWCLWQVEQTGLQSSISLQQGCWSSLHMIILTWQTRQVQYWFWSGRTEFAKGYNWLQNRTCHWRNLQVFTKACQKQEHVLVRTPLQRRWTRNNGTATYIISTWQSSSKWQKSQQLNSHDVFHPAWKLWCVNCHHCWGTQPLKSLAVVEKYQCGGQELPPQCPNVVSHFDKHMLCKCCFCFFFSMSTTTALYGTSIQQKQ